MQAVLIAFPGAMLGEVREAVPAVEDTDPAAEDAAEGYATDDVDPLNELD